MNLLDLLDRPIAYHRIFARLSGSVQAALMLSQAVYWQNRATGRDGWWWKKTAQWTDETGLSRREQETARRKLRQFDFWQEERRGSNPPRLHYRLDAGKLREALENADSHKSANSICTKAPNGNGGKRQMEMADSAICLKEQRLLTEITSETTPPAALFFPRCLTEAAKRQSALNKLAGLDAAAAQLLLDAVAWQAGNGGFHTRDGRKSTALRFLDYLRREFDKGGVDDSGALAVAARRRAQRQTEKPRAAEVPGVWRRLAEQLKSGGRYG